MTFHKSNLGDFGKNLPCDRQGYVHTDIEGWLGADMGADLAGYSAAEKRDWAKEQADNAREATKEAHAALAEWRA